MSELEQKLCFVVSPIGENGHDIRRRADKILRHVIKPIAHEKGYNVVRSDEIGIPGSITLQLIQRLIDADLVIADLTGHNPNVFYELGIRHAFRKPFVQIIEEGDVKLPFDIADLRTIKINHQDLDSVADCKEELARHIDAILTGEEVKTPVSQSIDLDALRKSPNLAESSIPDILDSMSALRVDIASLHREIRLSSKKEESEIQPPSIKYSRRLSVSIVEDFIRITIRRYTSKMIKDFTIKDILFSLKKDSLDRNVTDLISYNQIVVVLDKLCKEGVILETGPETYAILEMMNKEE